MRLTTRWVRLAFGAVFFAAMLACQTTDIVQVAQQPTATSTRTPRPTFTPLPTQTLTPVPTATKPPPTRTPTRRPTARPTTRVPTKPPPTQPPAQPPPPAQPTQPPAPQFPYAANPPWCEHSGLTYIKGRIYDSANSDANGVGGVGVALGGGGGTDPWVRIKSEDDGFYTFILSDPGQPAKNGTYHIWLTDSNGRISDIGGPIVINGLAPDAPGSCWAGHVDFWRR